MNTTSSYRLCSLFAAVAAAGVVAGCGGSDETAAPVPGPIPIPATQAVPDSASASVGGLIAYLKALTASTNADALEPVEATRLTAPVSDTTEPESLS